MPRRPKPRKPHRRERPGKRTCMRHLLWWLQRQKQKVSVLRAKHLPQAARQSTAFACKILSSSLSFAKRLLCSSRSLGNALLCVNKWMLLDKLWDVTTVTLSLADIVCDASVLFQFYARGYFGLFKAGCLIFAIAQLSYAFVFVVMYPPCCGTDRARLVLFLKILPVAQLVPFFIWLQSFEIPAVNRCLSWVDVEVPKDQAPSENSHKKIQYIRTKARKHAGFIAEAFSEAIPQCLLQTAAICMYPELASPLSIYSILSSISVVASKAYLFSFAAHVPTRLFNLICMIADLLNVFATTAWIFERNSATDHLEQPFLLRCFARAAWHGCLGAVLGYLAIAALELRCDRQRGVCIEASHRWAFFFEFVQLLLFLLPGVVVLAIMKLSLIPLAVLKTFVATFEANIEACLCFEEKVNQLLDVALPQAERERRICLVNVFALFAELRIRSGTSTHSLPDACLQDVCTYMFYRGTSVFHAPDAEMVPVLGLIEPAASGTLALRSACQKQQASEARASWKSLLKQIGQLIQDPHTVEFQADPLRLRTPPAQLDHQDLEVDVILIVQSLLSHAWQFWFKKCLHAASSGDLVEKLLCLWIVIWGACSVPHFFLSAGYSSLFVGQGLLYPTLRLGLLLWHADEGSIDSHLHGIQTLQMVLSMGFTFCLLVLAVLLPSVIMNIKAFSSVIFCLRPSRLPQAFFCPAIADAIEKTLAADDRCTEMVKSLRRKGLSTCLLAEVMKFVGPVCFVSKKAEVVQRSEQHTSKGRRRAHLHCS